MHHPKEFHRYLAAWLKAAFKPAADVIGGVASFVGAAVWGWHKWAPGSFAATVGKLGLSAEAAMSDLAWEIPLWIGAAVFLWRLVRAPYEIHLQTVAALESAEAVIVQQAVTQAEKVRVDAVRNFIGEELSRSEQLTNDEAELWARRIRGFVEAAFGPGEAALLWSNTGYVFFGGNKLSNLVEGRRRRLVSLVERLSSLTLLDTFNLDDWKRPQ
jgi:hypothetical protein